MKVKISPPSTTSSLQHWLDYWDSIHVTAIDLGLERIRPVAEHLQLLKPDAHVVTVAGTNGKGSTTTTIAAIYQAAGYQVGLYQSPHIYRFNERIKLNGVEVDDQSLIAAFNAVEQARLACQLSLSFFEATTLAAFSIFKQHNCDIWVLEVGLGGRLDAVNLIDPNVAVITNIGLDHTDWLGDSIEKIAFEKAGIMRAGIPVVFSENPLPAAITEQAEQLQCQLFVGGRDYHWQYQDSNFYYASPACTLSLPLPQLAMVNVAAAISAVLVGIRSVSEQALREGVAQARIAGRFEIRQFDQRSIILDVAHNTHGVLFLLKQLELFRQRSAATGAVHLVFSMLADKDIESVAALLKPVVKHWYIAPLSGERAASLSQLRKAVHNAPANEYDSVTAAFMAALAHSQPQDIILVCGSFHTLEAVWESSAIWQ
ncbi:bifunctional tetrahydrofolate synthase/dihydrofolate synthase [Alkanindiges sp. WGS2144]|uniref:bifunctional tetrahydrofolate synthase/dihydrofolate synthase n=1 Tax=Alkanindiges sp. WGS2144 TaxID=3366808 RepID=UPI00375214E6